MDVVFSFLLIYLAGRLASEWFERRVTFLMYDLSLLFTVYARSQQVQSQRVLLYQWGEQP